MIHPYIWRTILRHCDRELSYIIPLNDEQFNTLLNLVTGEDELYPFSEEVFRWLSDKYLVSMHGVTGYLPDDRGWWLLKLEWLKRGLPTAE